jgi:hypothetical protein
MKKLFVIIIAVLTMAIKTFAQENPDAKAINQRVIQPFMLCDSCRVYYADLRKKLASNLQEDNVQFNWKFVGLTEKDLIWIMQHSRIARGSSILQATPMIEEWRTEDGYSGYKLVVPGSNSLYLTFDGIAYLKIDDGPIAVKAEAPYSPALVQNNQPVSAPPQKAPDVVAERPAQKADNLPAVADNSGGIKIYNIINNGGGAVMTENPIVPLGVTANPGPMVYGTYPTAVYAVCGNGTNIPYGVVPSYGVGFSAGVVVGNYGVYGYPNYYGYPYRSYGCSGVYHTNYGGNCGAVYGRRR